MIQARRGVCLSLDARPIAWSRAASPGSSLIATGRRSLGIVGEIHFAHPARADQRPDFIPAESRSGARCMASVPPSSHIAGVTTAAIAVVPLGVSADQRLMASLTVGWTPLSSVAVASGISLSVR